jgi:hypothetical protein
MYPVGSPLGEWGEALMLVVLEAREAERLSEPGEEERSLRSVLDLGWEMLSWVAPFVA